MAENAEKLKLRITIEAYKQIRAWLDSRILEMEQALNRPLETRSLSFDPPISIEDPKIKWLERKILEPHRSSGLKWKFKFAPGSNDVVQLILWIPQTFDDKHVAEIKRCVDWVSKKAKENQQ